MIAHGLALLGPVEEPKNQVTDLNFNEIETSSESTPSLQTYEARDGTRLSYRSYQSEADRVLVLLHGSGYHSRYLAPLASRLADAGVATVYTPNMRGHGPNPEKRGQVDYIGQLEHDIDDLMAHIKMTHPNQPIILGGHSSGGGTVIRYAGGSGEHDIAKYLLIAPYIHHESDVNNSENGWANVSLPRMIGLSMLNQIGLTYLNGQSVISFNMPEAYRDGTETLTYDYRLQTSMHPRSDFQSDIAGLDEETLVVAGTDDGSFHAKAYEEVFASNQLVNVTILDGLSHFGILRDEDAQKVMSEWIED
ncbi:pimeloyl-ACP methyl ester carboxylesterase [Alkalibacillus flavidus]|uniref:Pimeloyl-ACP methyl ester carboxylesterase n=1 Tax=Alkalibacillus flavidus TaxID=546021 RepID=A0ABV2KYG2_9BACI